MNPKAGGGHRWLLTLGAPAIGLAAVAFFFTGFGLGRTTQQHLMLLAGLTAIALGSWWIVVLLPYKAESAQAKWAAVLGPFGLGLVFAGLTIVSFVVDLHTGLYAGAAGMAGSFVFSGFAYLRRPSA